MPYTLHTAPEIEPLTVEEAKVFLRQDHAIEDDLIGELIKTAREHIEQDQRRQLITATYELSLPCFPDCREIPLLYPPLQSVTSVKYFVDGVETTFDASNYSVDIKKTPGRIVLKENASWPSTDNIPNAVIITFVCGYGDEAGDVPHLTRQALRLLVNHHYSHRGDEEKPVPNGIQNLIAKGYWGDYQ